MAKIKIVDSTKYCRGYRETGFLIVKQKNSIATLEVW